MKLENNLMFTKKKELKEKSYTAIAEQSKAPFLEASSESDMTKITVLLAKGKGLNDKSETIRVEMSDLQKKKEYRLRLVF